MELYLLIHFLAFYYHYLSIFSLIIGYSRHVVPLLLEFLSQLIFHLIFRQQKNNAKGVLIILMRIGTCGYTYSWNKSKPSPFKWYLDQHFNSVEINASFYRFPTESWIRTWQDNAPKDFTFSIKVHRSITHYTKLKGSKSIELWERFVSTLESVTDKIDFWLFQLPANYKYSIENASTIKAFFEMAKLPSNNAVIEFRDSSWWKQVRAIAKIGIVFCSVSAPGLPNDIITTNNTIYLRLHGSKEWYNYAYTKRELDNILLKMKKSKAKKKAIYLNNNHGMLKNGLYLLEKTQ